MCIFEGLQGSLSSVYCAKQLLLFDFFDSHQRYSLPEITSVLTMGKFVKPNLKLSEEEVRCEQHFAFHTTRVGRSTLRFPFSEHPSTLGESREIATKRLSHNERKLDKNPLLKEQYHAFLWECVSLGHMSLAPTSGSRACVFLPHHSVVKDWSSTTKCRVVFLWFKQND